MKTHKHPKQPKQSKQARVLASVSASIVPPLSRWRSCDALPESAVA
ncbi:MAG: hypothetical protein OHK0022_34920 [Roseiflexaceae bacterium]